MKKIVICLFILLLSSAIPMNAQDSKVNAGGLYYELSDNGEATVVESPLENKYSGNIVIPENIEVDGKTYAVTAIGESAFNMLSGIKTVEAKGTIRRIGPSAFMDCGMTELILHHEDELKEIDKLAFNGTTYLTSFYLPASVTVEFPNFQRGEFPCGIENFVVHPDNPYYKEIDGVLYSKDNNLLVFPMIRKGEYAIPEGTIKIGYNAFNWSGLTKVTIPETVETIDNRAFLYSNFSEITVPNSVKHIGEEAFNACFNLKSVSLGEGVETIGDGALGSFSLKTITCHATTPPTFDQSSYFISVLTMTDPVLYVPVGCVETYRNSPSWGVLTTILEIGQTNNLDASFTDEPSENHPVYDLSGRKLPSHRRLHKGIYIQNGKRVIVN